VSRKREGQVILQLRQAKRDSCKAWEDYWLKQGMAKEWVAYWRQNNWDWGLAEATEELRQCFDKKGFLVDPTDVC